MSDKIDVYTAGTGALPAEYWAWHLYGQGLENLGREGQPEVLPLPQFGSDQLLARIDACGLCFSDIKVIKQGGSHPRLFGRDLANDPIVLGHEVAMTIVGVGEDMKGQFKVGDRFVIQAEIYLNKMNLAFGYMLRGGLEQYAVLGDEVLRGDDGCYLIPIHESTGYAEAALAEPWACVVRAYRDTRRTSLKAGGKAWIVGTHAGGHLAYSTAGMDTSAVPDEIVISNCPPAYVQAIYNLVEVTGIKLVTADGHDFAEIANRHAPDGFDDIFVLGNDTATIEGVAPHLGKEAVLSIITEEPPKTLANLDVGRIHYDYHQYVAAGPGWPLGGYSHPRSLKFAQDGLCWIAGAGGPMGQMHVQLAVEASDGPRVVVATDIDTERLERLPKRFGEAAARRGVEFVLLNPKELGDQFDARLKEIAPAGFDDVVCLVPVPAIISHCSRFVGKRGVLNIFAGVARGTMAELDLSKVVENDARYFGSSGSSIDDLTHTLHLAETGELSPNMAVAAIGGLEAVKEGLAGVQDSSFPGKVVIYPQITGLPLTTLPELDKSLPDVAALLGPDYTWTAAAEKALLEHFLG